MPRETVRAAHVRVIQAIAMLGALLVALSLVWLQAIESEALSARAQAQYQDDIQILPERGNILDANHALLATATYRDNVEAAPNAVRGSGMPVQAMARDLAPLLGKSEGEIAALLDQPDKRYTLLAKGVTPAVSDRVKELIREGRAPGITLAPMAHRTYPLGMLAAHALGFYSQSGSGQYGLEGYYEALLRGEPGRRLSYGAPFSKETGGVSQVLQPAEPGADLVLTLDSAVQHVVERELEAALERFGASSGSVIVMDPKTGGIIAMASRPTYDSNAYQEAHSPDGDAFANPIISQVYEPGSTFKVITLAAALDSGRISPHTAYYDGGSIRYGGEEFSNWDGKGHGQSDITDLIAHSSNVGAVFVGSQLGKEFFYEYVAAFGFGTPTGVDLWGEVSGFVPNPDSRTWYPSSLATNAFGQGIAVTPLQLVTAVSAIVNDGVLMRPHLVQEIHTPEGVRRVEPMAVRRVVRPETARTLLAMLVEASTRSESSMHLIEGYTVAGKTGTASIPLETGGYDQEFTIASYVGFGPVEDPRFVILVKIDRPTVEPWGSLVAAPVFRAVASELFLYYHIPPSTAAQTLVKRENVGQRQ